MRKHAARLLPLQPLPVATKLKRSGRQPPGDHGSVPMGYPPWFVELGGINISNIYLIFNISNINISNISNIIHPSVISIDIMG